MAVPPRRRETLRNLIAKYHPDASPEALEEWRRELGDLDQPLYTFKDLLRAIEGEDEEV